jgi:hypothetical protein
MKESRQITLGSSDSTTVPTDFKYRMQGKVVTITYSGAGLAHKELGRILRKIEYWHQSSVTSYRILYNDAGGLGGEVKVGRRNCGSDGATHPPLTQARGGSGKGV